MLHTSTNHDTCKLFNLIFLRERGKKKKKNNKKKQKGKQSMGGSGVGERRGRGIGNEEKKITIIMIKK